jgi:hypothetical protein
MSRRQRFSSIAKRISVRFLLFFTALFISAAPAALFSAQELLSSASSYPNPFDARTGAATITYTLSRDQRVTLRIYNVYGAEIAGRDFAAAELGGRQGVNAATWNGTDGDGRKVAKGMYLAVLRAAGDREVLKIGVVH